MSAESVPVKTFVSYTKKDDVLCERVVGALGELESAGLIKVWIDRLIIPGENYYERIIKRYVFQPPFTVCRERLGGVLRYYYRDAA